MSLLALLATTSALAADGPSLWFRQGVGLAGWPTGLLSTTQAEARLPLYRSESIVFKQTFAGAGAFVQASPAFVVVGPRVTLAPIDVFDLTLEGGYGGYFGNGLGAMPMNAPGASAESIRRDRADLGEGVATQLLVGTAKPTLKAKAWKILLFDAWTVDALSFTQPVGVTAPHTYEPLRDLVVSWQDIAFEHQAGVLFEALPGGDKPSLRIGATYRDRWAHVSGDRNAGLGALVSAKPGTKPAVPTLVGMALWYVMDADYGGSPIPYLAAQARWELEKPLGKPR